MDRWSEGVREREKEERTKEITAHTSSTHCPHVVVEESSGRAWALLSLTALGVEAVLRRGLHHLWESPEAMPE